MIETQTAMKRSILLLVAMVVMFASSATAQERRVKYHGEVFVAGDIAWANMNYAGDRVSRNDVLIYGASLHTIQGVKIGDHFSLGVGLGVDFLIGLDDDDAEVGGLLIPIYLDCKYWMPTKGEVAPFVMAEGGGSFLIYPQTIAPLYGVGVGFKVSKFTMSLGYMRDGCNLREFFDENDNLKFYEHKLQLRIGVSF